MRERELRVAAADAGEIGREVGDALGDQVDHVTLALDPTTYRAIMLADRTARCFYLA